MECPGVSGSLWMRGHPLYVAGEFGAGLEGSGCVWYECWEQKNRQKSGHRLRCQEKVENPDFNCTEAGAALLPLPGLEPYTLISCRTHSFLP